MSCHISFLALIMCRLIFFLITVGVNIYEIWTYLICNIDASFDKMIIMFVIQGNVFFFPDTCRRSYPEVHKGPCVETAICLKACNFIKKRPQHRCFPVKFVKPLRTLLQTPPVAASAYHTSIWWRFFPTIVNDFHDLTL